MLSACHYTIEVTVEVDAIEVNTIEVNDKNPKFKIGDHVRISKHKITFSKGYTQNWSEEGFVIKKVKNTVPCSYVNSDLNAGKIIGTFYEKRTAKNNSKRI